MKRTIVANWKSNPITQKDAKKLFNAFKKQDVVICPPFIYLDLGNKKGVKYKLGGQNCHWEQSGAFTGEISPKMLKDLDCKYVIVGHSERRNYFKETDETINKKLKIALKIGLIPIFCIGEKKGQRAEMIVFEQLSKGLKGIAKKELKKIIIAYEPVWAIGTGNFCSPDKANKIREFIKSNFKNKILYGGSVNSKISNEYLKIGFDGFLVGGASLNVKEFLKIIKNA